MKDNPIQTWMEGLGFKWEINHTGVGGVWVLDTPYIVVPNDWAAFFYAVMEREKIEERLGTLEMTRDDYEDTLRRNWIGFENSVPKFWIETELGVLDNEIDKLKAKLATLNKGEEWCKN